MKKLMALPLLLGAGLLLSGCGTPMKVMNGTPLNQLPAVVETEDDYYIQVGDVVRVEVSGVTDVRADADAFLELPVRPDGKVYLPILEDSITIAGYTPDEARINVMRAYSAYVKNPSVSLNIMEFSDRNIYVAGEITGERVVPYLKSMTVTRAVAAGAHDVHRANLKNVIVVRQQGAENPPLVFSVNMEEALTNVDVSQDVALMPNDVVFVPKTGVVRVNDFIDRYINRNIPLPGLVTGAALIYATD